MEANPKLDSDFKAATDAALRGLHQAAFDAPEIEIYAIDAKTHQFIAVNKTGLASQGLQMHEMQNLRIYDMLGDIAPVRIKRLLDWSKRRATGTVTFRLRRVSQSGDENYMRVVFRYLHGAWPSYLVIMQDISRYHEARIAAATAADVLSTAIEALPDGFVLYDKGDRLVACNDRYKQIYTPSAAAMTPGTRFKDILRYGLERGQYADGIGREDAWLRDRLAAHRAADTTVEQELNDGTWLRIVERATKDGGRVGLRIDITEFKNQQEKLRKSARTDYLTGALNRRGMYEELINLSETLDDGQRIAVLHIDLDKFKSINDAQGHSAGDFVLRHCSRILHSVNKTHGFVARAGGDEFIVFMATRKDDAEVQGLADRLIRRLAQPVTFRDRLCNFGASVGVSFYDGASCSNIEETLTGADIALNHAKLAGRGQSVVFEDTMRNDTVELIQMAQQIRIGLQNGQFEPFFQPQIDTATGRIAGFESLIRWRHPTKGLVPAYKFLAAAEWAGLMDDLDHVIMDRSCFAAAQIKQWGMQDMSVSINMSLGQLRDPRMLERLLQYSKVYGIEPSDLRIELLESILLDERSTVIMDNVHKFIEHGVAVELDDFGTGHAAIATLRKFAVSRIKIDRSFVQNIDGDSELQVITGAIIQLADRLGISPLAEGVETQAEQDKLHDLGCTVVQGYLHARPMPLVQLRAWIITHLSENAVAESDQMPASA